MFFFRSIFLGETFTSYVSVRNDSKETVSEVQLKADLQAGHQRSALTRPDAVPTASLPPDGSVDDIVSHEVKELGIHMCVNVK